MVENHTGRKNNIGNMAREFIGFLGYHHWTFGRPYNLAWIFQVKKKRLDAELRSRISR